MNFFGKVIFVQGRKFVNFCWKIIFLFKNVISVKLAIFAWKHKFRNFSVNIILFGKVNVTNIAIFSYVKLEIFWKSYFYPET
jgi:hypothetical protein